MSSTIAPIALLDKTLRGVDKLPPFSPVLTKVMASLTNSEVMICELADSVEKDTVLTGNVLRMANSAAFGRLGKVASVPHAITMLGMNRLRNIVLSLSVCNMMSQLKLPAGWSARQFNSHAVAVANLSDLVAQNSKIEYPEGAFVAGLLHDVGKLLMAVSCPDEYSKVIAAVKRSGRTFYEVELEQLGFSHAEVSEKVMEKWKLPVPVQMAGRSHHDPDTEDGGQGVRELSRAVRVADLVVNALGIPAVADGREPTDPAPFLQAFGLGAKAPQILKSFDREMDAIRGML